MAHSRDNQMNKYFVPKRQPYVMYELFWLFHELNWIERASTYREEKSRLTNLA